MALMNRVRRLGGGQPPHPEPSGPSGRNAGNCTRTEVLNGTIQEAFAQAVALNPDFELPNLTDKVAGATEVVNGLVGGVVGGVTGPANTKRGTNVICGNFEAADRGRIVEAIQHLMNLTTAPRMGSGPRVCARVSCTNNSGVWWCNDVSVVSCIHSKSLLPLHNP